MEDLEKVLLEDGEGDGEHSGAENALFCNRCSRRFSTIDAKFMCDSCFSVCCHACTKPPSPAPTKSPGSPAFGVQCVQCQSKCILGVVRTQTASFTAMRTRIAVGRDGPTHRGMTTVLAALTTNPKAIRKPLLALWGEPDCFKVNWRPARACAGCGGEAKACCAMCGAPACAACLSGRFCPTQTERGVTLREWAAEADSGWWPVVCCARCTAIASRLLGTARAPAAPRHELLVAAQAKLAALRLKISSLMGPYGRAVGQLGAEGGGRDGVAQLATLEYDLSSLFTTLAVSLQELPTCRMRAKDRLLDAVAQAFVAFYRERYLAFRRLARAAAELVPPPVRREISAAVDVRALTCACALVQQLAYEAMAFEEVALGPLLRPAVETVETALQAAVGASWDSHRTALRALVRANGSASPLITPHVGRAVGWRGRVARQCDYVLCVAARELSLRSSHTRSAAVCAVLLRTRRAVAELLADDGWVVM